jgi:hypothetical protein
MPHGQDPLHPAIPFLAAGPLAAYAPQDIEAVGALRSADRNTIATVVERDPMADAVIAVTCARIRRRCTMALTKILPNFYVFLTTCSLNSRNLQVGILQPLLGMQVTPWIWHHHL